MIDALFITSGNITGISAGSGYSLVLLKDGSVTGWGNNNYGQLDIPIGISGITTGISASATQGLARLNDGWVSGWGYNSQSVPHDIQYNISDFSAGVNFNAAILKTNGTVTGWGVGGEFLAKILLHQVTGLTGAKKVSAGASHFLILTSGNWVTGFGNNTYGQLNIPTGISGKVTEISAGAYHSLALLTGGVVTGWGNNSSGQLNIPLSISGKVTGISAGGYHSLALLTGKWVTGWGDNSFSQLNISTDISGKVSAISAGWDHNLILLEDGSAVAYGNNSLGALNGLVPISIDDFELTTTVYGDLPSDLCQTTSYNNFELNLKGIQDFTPLYNSKHKFIIYKSGINTGYLPFLETDYNSYTQGKIVGYTGFIDSGNYKTEIKTIYQNSETMPSFCNAGVQVANLIDISYSNKFALELFKSNSRILLETFIQKNSGLNEVATIHFSDDIYVITGHDFTKNTGVLLSGIIFLEPYEKEKEGIAINDALDYAIQNLSWSVSKIKIINVITNNFPYIESDVDPCAGTLSFSTPPIEIKYETVLNKIATYINSEDITFNFIYIDKELNYITNKSKFLYNEKDLKTFYMKAAQIGNGFFGDNDISIVGNSPLNASYRLSKLPFCPSMPLISTSSILGPRNCCSTGTPCQAGEKLVIDYIKYVENCGFCPNYVCSTGLQNNTLTCGTNPSQLNENDNVNLEAHLVSHDLKDRLIVWISGCDHRFDCNFINSNEYINNFATSLNNSGLTLFDTTCVGTNGDLPPNSIPYNWEKFGNLFKATNNLVFQSGMFPLGVCIVPNCNTSTTGTRYFASINGFVSGNNFYTRSFASGDLGICQQGNDL